MIQKFKDLHKGGTCVIIGNGPSLDSTPLVSLAKKYITFGANKIYASSAHPDFVPDYWTCIDDLMLTDCVPWMVSHPDYKAEKFVPRSIPLPGAHGLTTRVEISFSLDPVEYVSLGGTVTYVSCQLAKWMGIDTVLFVGLDHRYPKAEKGGKAGSRFIASGNDADHFSVEGGQYFKPGYMYNRPELDAVEKYFFPLVKMNFKRVYNLTPNTAEKIFDKGTFEKWL